MPFLFRAEMKDFFLCCVIMLHIYIYSWRLQLDYMILYIIEHDNTKNIISMN